MSEVPHFDPAAPKSAYMRFLERLAKLRPVTWTLINVGNSVDPVLMKLTNGHLKLAPGSPIVVLHNHGAKSGKLRKTPLAYVSDGDDVILTASKGGAENHPAWIHNIRANPGVELWVGSRGGPYTARVANPEERARLWPLITGFFSGYEDYQERAGGREIQVVICSPRS